MLAEIPILGISSSRGGALGVAVGTGGLGVGVTVGRGGISVGVTVGGAMVATGATPTAAGEDCVVATGGAARPNARSAATLDGFAPMGATAIGVVVALTRGLAHAWSAASALNPKANSIARRREQTRTTDLADRWFPGVLANRGFDSFESTPQILDRVGVREP